MLDGRIVGHGVHQFLYHRNVTPFVRDVLAGRPQLPHHTFGGHAGMIHTVYTAFELFKRFFIPLVGEIRTSQRRGVMRRCTDLCGAFRECQRLFRQDVSVEQLLSKVAIVPSPLPVYRFLTNRQPLGVCGIRFLGIASRFVGIAQQFVQDETCLQFRLQLFKDGDAFVLLPVVGVKFPDAGAQNRVRAL